MWVGRAFLIEYVNIPSMSFAASSFDLSRFHCILFSPWQCSLKGSLSWMTMWGLAGVIVGFVSPWMGKRMYLNECHGYENARKCKIKAIFLKPSFELKALQFIHLEICFVFTWPKLLYSSKMFSALWNQAVSTYMAPQASHASWKLRDKISDVKLNIRVAHIKFLNKRFILAIIHKLTNSDTNFMCKTSSVYLFALNIYDLWLLETTWIVLMASVLRM